MSQSFIQGTPIMGWAAEIEAVPTSANRTGGCAEVGERVVKNQVREPDAPMTRGGGAD
jgi:hypothetical protein